MSGAFRLADPPEAGWAELGVASFTNPASALTDVPTAIAPFEDAVPGTLANDEGSRPV
jgi:hypothetical protein